MDNDPISTAPTSFACPKGIFRHNDPGKYGQLLDDERSREFLPAHKPCYRSSSRYIAAVVFPLVRRATAPWRVDGNDFIALADQGIRLVLNLHAAGAQGDWEGKRGDLAGLHGADQGIPPLPTQVAILSIHLASHFPRRDPLRSACPQLKRLLHPDIHSPLVRDVTIHVCRRRARFNSRFTRSLPS